MRVLKIQRKGKGREGKGKEGKGREGKGKEGKGSQGERKRERERGGEGLVNKLRRTKNN